MASGRPIHPIEVKTEIAQACAPGDAGTATLSADRADCKPTLFLLAAALLQRKPADDAKGRGC
jgi:hypothetical protein